MKRILFIVLLCVSVSSCGLFKKRIEKHTDKQTEKTQTDKTQTADSSSQTQEKSQQEKHVLEFANQSQTTQIRAEQISYNAQNGDFTASGNVVIITNRKTQNATQNQEVLTTEKESKNSQSVSTKELSKETKQTTTKKVSREKNVLPILLKCFLFIILLVFLYVVYRKIREKIVTFL